MSTMYIRTFSFRDSLSDEEAFEYLSENMWELEMKRCLQKE